MAKKLTVVISQGQSKNPRQRNLEEEVAARLIMEGEVEVSIVPHLYDMQADHTGLLFLRGVAGPMVVLSWAYPRAARWILDRQGVKGLEGVSHLVADETDADEDAEPEAPQGIGSVAPPKRRIYCIDFRASENVSDFLEEIRRITREQSEQVVELMGWINGSPDAKQLDRYLAQPAADENSLPIIPSPQDSEPPKRRWYPVIDYSRCTNCMECIDFCLFGVYGVDTLDRILVEAQDNCKKGCPACSRVCPENAIVFPQHKTPAIAGADGEVAGLKIDLTQLFGGGGEQDALELAIAERDSELVKDGRDAVGSSVGLSRRRTKQSDQPKDDLDELMDDLDALSF
ncbi:MAG: ferredoxin family protein [Planctomycetaceae bacterium]|nr:ferredoxin family protein [Planctomycetaceae bacterium]